MLYEYDAFGNNIKVQYLDPIYDNQGKIKKWLLRRLTENTFTNQGKLSYSLDKKYIIDQAKECTWLQTLERKTIEYNAYGARSFHEIFEEKFNREGDLILSSGQRTINQFLDSCLLEAKYETIYAQAGAPLQWQEQNLRTYERDADCKVLSSELRQVGQLSQKGLFFYDDEGRRIEEILEYPQQII